MGGEKFVDESHFYKNLGSPPHGRGKELSTLPVIFLFRITPALAGKRGKCGVKLAVVKDHPRVGGEKISMSSTVFFWQGSPPRGRGKGLRQLSGVAHHRSTPAWAGKSIRCTSTTRLIRDHPRMGGEKMTRRYSSVPVPGSPLRGRGKAGASMVAPALWRITPAWAGKSVSRRPRWTHTGDHPRVGGEKNKEQTRSIGKVGSPPRRRGKARHLSHGLLPCG